MTAKITYQQLKAAGACTPQLVLFRERYGDEVTVTVEVAREAAGLFNWRWAARKLLEPAAYEAYKDSAWAAFKAARNSARAAYEKNPVWEAYIAAEDSALEVYDAACAEAFARLYIEQEAGK